MAMPDASLRDSFLACLRLFEKCSEDIKACGINSAWVDDKAASLRIWGASLGVMAEKHASLQHRLRDSEDMRSLIMQFLEGLWSNLSFLTRECSLLLVNEDSVAICTLRETFEKALGLDGPLTYNDDGDDQAFTNAEASSTPDSSDSESPHSSRSGQPDDNSECSEHLDVPICVEQVDALLKRLNRLAFAIRVAGTHQRDNRAETYRHIVPTAEGDFDMTASFKEYADDVVDHRVASAAEFLRRRLASSIARRQNRFLYRRRHRTQLEGGVNGREHASSEMQPEKKRPRTSGLLAVTPKSDGFRRTSLASASVGNTTATSMPNLATSASQYSRSDVSTSASLSTPYTSGGAVKFPPPPTEFAGDHFLCPFCSIWCHKKLSKKSRWEKHVIQDMDPFVCVFQTCSKANELFCSVGAWISHMSAEHTTKSWLCSLSSCLDVSTGRSTSYDNQNAYFNHVRQAHNIQISDAEFQLLSEMSIRPNRLVFENCPFCDEMPEEIIAMFEEDVFSDLAQRALQQHISDHLYELSFISTNPNWLDYHEGENASLVSDGSAAKQLSYQSELSSLSGFSGYIEGSVATDDGNLELHEPRSGMGHIYPSDHIRGKVRLELFVKAWIDSLPNSASEVFFTGDQLKTAAVDNNFLEIEEYHNRIYQSYAINNLSYFAPSDEDEIQRLNSFHNVLNRVFDGRLIFPPIQRPRRILDCGYGTGAWAAEVAEQNPQCEVFGVDINPMMQLDEMPDNLYLQVDDLNRRFTFPAHNFDLVHSRMVATGIHANRWPQYLRDLLRVTRPGGWTQMVELYFNAQSDNGSLTDVHALSQWSARYLESIKGLKDLQAPLRLSEMMREAGFVDVEHRMIQLPMCGWATDQRENEIGTANKENIHSMLSSLAIYPFTKRLRMSIQDVHLLVAQARLEADNPAFKAYFPLYVCIGRKPRSRR